MPHEIPSFHSLDAKKPSPQPDRGYFEDTLDDPWRSEPETPAELSSKERGYWIDAQEDLVRHRQNLLRDIRKKQEARAFGDAHQYQYHLENVPSIETPDGPSARWNKREAKYGWMADQPLRESASLIPGRTEGSRRIAGMGRSFDSSYGRLEKKAKEQWRNVKELVDELEALYEEWADLRARAKSLIIHASRPHWMTLEKRYIRETEETGGDFLGTPEEKAFLAIIDQLNEVTRMEREVFFAYSRAYEELSYKNPWVNKSLALEPDLSELIPSKSIPLDGSETSIASFLSDEDPEAWRTENPWWLPLIDLKERYAREDAAAKQAREAELRHQKTLLRKPRHAREEDRFQPE